jgi:hypothetical protein
MIMAQETKEMGDERRQSSYSKNVEVSGAIDTRFTPEFLKDIKTGQEQEHTRETNRFKVEIATLFIVLAYTTIALWQGSSSQRAANAAKSAADTAKETLWATEGANIVTKKPTFDTVSHRALLPFGNDGRTTSGPATITVHEATFAADPQTGTSKAVIEAHWETGPVDSIPTDEPDNSGEIAIPAVTVDGITKGTQIVTMAGEIDYDIGIPNAPHRTWVFCYSTHFNWNTQKSEARACMPSRTIPMLKTIEHYPNNGTRY